MCYTRRWIIIQSQLNLNEKSQKRRIEILTGSPWKTIFTVCGPMALFQIINQLFRIFDLSITAQIDTESVAAVSFFSQISNTFNNIGIGFAMGAGILIAGSYGAGDYTKVKKYVNSSFCIAFIGALLLSGTLIIFSSTVLKIANTPSDLIKTGLAFYKCEMLRLVFTYFNSVYIAIEKARGNGRIILLLNLVLAFVKISFSALFVLVLHKNIVMISIATLLANIVLTICGLLRLRNSQDVFGLSLSYINLKKRTLALLMKISLPVIAEKVAFSAGKVMVNSIGVAYGTEVIGALGVSNTISSISTTPPTSIGDGGAAIISQNLGNNNKSRAIIFFRSILIVNVVFGIVGFIITLIFLDPLVLTFSKGDVSFGLKIKDIFTLEMCSNIFLAINSSCMSLLYGLGFTKISFVINFSRLFVFRLPILLIFKFFTNIQGSTVLGLVMMISNGLTGIIAITIAIIILKKEFGEVSLRQFLSFKYSIK